MVDLSEQLKESNFYELTVKILRYLKKINYRYKIFYYFTNSCEFLKSSYP